MLLDRLDRARALAEQQPAALAGIERLVDLQPVDAVEDRFRAVGLKVDAVG